MARFLTDNFTDADNTSLASHTSDSGSSWAKGSNFSSATAKILANRAIGTSGNNGGWVASQAQAGTAGRQVVVASVKVMDAGFTAVGPYSCADAGGTNGYQAACLGAGYIFLYNALGFSALYAVTWIPGDTHTVTIDTISDATHTYVQLDGSTIIDYADSSRPTGTKAGLYFNDSADATHGLHIDSLTADDDNNPAATIYAVTGTLYGDNGSASPTITLTPNGTSSAVVTITPSGGGLSTPQTVTFDGTATAKTFTITPTAEGTVTLTYTNDAGLIDPSASSYQSCDPLTIGFVCDGDSRFTDIDSSGVTTPQVLADVSHFNTHTKANTAVAGETIQQRASAAAMDVDPLLSSLSQFNHKWVITQFGINDVYAGATGSTTYSRASGYVADRLTAGFDGVVLCTAVKAVTVSGSAETARQSFNTLLLATPPTGSIVVDIASMIEFSDTTNATYFLDDQIHFTDLGRTVVADQVFAQFPLPPAAPSNLVATAASSSQINLTFTLPSGTSGYIEKSTDNMTFVAAAFTDTDATSASIGGLIPNTEYYFRMKALTGNFGPFDEDEQVWLNIDGTAYSFSFNVDQGENGFLSDDAVESFGNLFLLADYGAINGTLYEEAIAGLVTVNYTGLVFGANVGTGGDMTVTIDSDHTQLSDFSGTANATTNSASGPSATGLHLHVGIGL